MKIIDAIINILSKWLKWDEKTHLDGLEIPQIAPTPQNSPVETSAPLNDTSAAQRVYQAASDGLGRHLTLNASVSPEVGCAEAVSLVLLNAGYAIPQGGIASVKELIAWMQHQGFKEVQEGTPGCVITAAGNPSAAHVGIVVNHGVASNTSYDDPAKGLKAGLFQQNYRSIAIWTQSFAREGSVTRFFLPV